MPRAADGSWLPESGGGGGFTDRTLESLRAHPPHGDFKELDAACWAEHGRIGRPAADSG